MTSSKTLILYWFYQVFMKNHLFLLRTFRSHLLISLTFSRYFEGSRGLLLRPFGLAKNVKDMVTGVRKGLTKRGKENEEKSKNQMRPFRSHLPIYITKIGRRRTGQWVPGRSQGRSARRFQWNFVFWEEKKKRNEHTGPQKETFGPSWCWGAHKELSRGRTKKRHLAFQKNDGTVVDGVLFNAILDRFRRPS